MPLLLVRHARAGHRNRWDGDDDERPLDRRGTAQAGQLVHALSRFRLDRVLSSPAKRCVQTVEPLAAARGLEIELCELSEARQFGEGAALLASHAGDDVLVCGHGGLEHALREPPPTWRKGATLVVGPGLALEGELPPTRQPWPLGGFAPHLGDELGRGPLANAAARDAKRDPEPRSSRTSRARAMAAPGQQRGRERAR